MKRVLAVVAHPDDETLGCGGTLAVHIACGDFVSVMAFTNGTARKDSDHAKIVRRRHFFAALKALGMPRMFDAELSGTMFRAEPEGYGTCYIGMSDQRLDVEPMLDLARRVETALEWFKPDIVYTHSLADLNADHRRVHEAVLCACRPLPGTRVQELYAFEVLSSTEWCPAAAFRPTAYVDIRDTLDMKLAAMAAYKDEVRPFPHPRSLVAIRALAVYRGVSAGLEAAEAFEVVRLVR